MLILKDYSVKIIDFGFSMYESENAKKSKVRSGTPGFYSPENLNKKLKSCISDMFSLGAIFYYLLNKQYLFDGKDADEITKKNKVCKIDQSQFLPFDTEEKALLLRLLESDPSKRISAKEASSHPYFLDLKS